MLELLSLATLIICIILIIRVSRLDMVLNDICQKMEKLSTTKSRANEQTVTQETPTHCVQTPATPKPIDTTTEPVIEPQLSPIPALPIIEVPKQPEIRPTNTKTKEPKNINFEKFFGTNLFGKISIDYKRNQIEFDYFLGVGG